MYELANIRFRYLASILFGIACPDTEKFVELERHSRPDAILGQFAEGESEDLHTRQTCVGIRVAIVVILPFELSSLLHHIVPCVDFLIVVIVEKVEWSARQRKCTGVRFLKLLKDTCAHNGLCSFVSFVHDNHIPVIEHYGSFQGIVVFAFIVDQIGQTEILNRREEHEFFLTTRNLGLDVREVIVIFQNIGIATIVLKHTGGVHEFWIISENFHVVQIPPLIDDGAMRYNQDCFVAFVLTETAGNFQTRQSLAKTHLGVPQELAVSFGEFFTLSAEVFYGGIYGSTLLRAERDFCRLDFIVIAIEGGVAFFYTRNGSEYRAQISLETNICR